MMEGSYSLWKTVFFTETHMFCISVVCIHNIENHFPSQLEVMFRLQTSHPPHTGSHLGLIPRRGCVTLRGTFHTPCVGASIGDLAKEVKEVLIENKGTSCCTFVRCTFRPGRVHRRRRFEPLQQQLFRESYCSLRKVLSATAVALRQSSPVSSGWFHPYEPLVLTADKAIYPTF